MIAQDRILQVLQSGVQKMAEVDLYEEPLLCAPDTILLGDGACLDSMGFVNFIVAIEDAVEREFGIIINIHEELSGSAAGKEAPLTVRAFTVLLTELVERRYGG